MGRNTRHVAHTSSTPVATAGHAVGLEQLRSTTTTTAKRGTTTGIPYTEPLARVGQQATPQRAAESEADTDSNTESSLGAEINYNTPEFAGLTNP